MVGLVNRFKLFVKTVIVELWSNGRGWILLTISVGWGLSIGVRYVFPTLLPYIQSDFQFGFSMIGLLLTILWISYAIGHIPGGIIGDHIGTGNLLAFSMLLSMGMIVVISSSSNTIMLFSGTILFGLATGLFSPARLAILTNIYKKQAGSAIGFSMAAGNVGNTGLPIAAAFVATYTSWRLGFGIFIPAFLISALSIWYIVPPQASKEESIVDNISWTTIKNVREGITHDIIPVMVTLQVSLSFVLQGFTSFYPTYLITMKDISPSLAATIFGIFFSIGALIQPVAGSLMAKYNSRHILIVLLNGCILALWMLPLATSITSLILITILISTINGCFVIIQTDITNLLPDDMQSTGIGILKAGWMILGATSPVVIGMVADRGYFNEAFFLLAAIGSFGLVFYLSYLVISRDNHAIN